MTEQPFLRQLLIFCAWTTIVAIGVDAYSSTRCEDTCYLNVFGIHQFDQVFHDDVYTILMEGSVAAEAEQVELQTLALHHLDIGNIVDVDGGKVWLPRDGAEAGELWAIKAYPIVIARMLVGERL